MKACRRLSSWLPQACRKGTSQLFPGPGPHPTQFSFCSTTRCVPPLWLRARYLLTTHHPTADFTTITMSTTDYSKLELNREGKFEKGSDYFAPTQDKDKVQLWANTICPFVQRTWMSLYMREVPHEMVLIGLGNDKPEWYTEKVNSRGTVPTLVSDGDMIFDSYVATMYVEERFADQGQAILPADVHLRAKSRLVITDFGDKVMRQSYQLLMNNSEEEEEKKREAVVAGFKLMNEHYASQSAEGPFFLGDKFSYVDLMFFPFALRFSILYKAFGFDLFESTKADRVQAMVEAARKLPFVAPTCLSDQEYRKGYEGYYAKRWDIESFQSKI